MIPKNLEIFTDYLDKKGLEWDYYKNKKLIDKYFIGYKDVCNEVVVVKFTNIEVTNTRREKTTLLDIYIAVCFLDGNIKGILGKQFTFTPEQYSSSYTFSHLRCSINSEAFNSFCFGYGYMGPLINKLKKLDSTAKAALFIQSLEKYLSWESLEGGPYRSIINIRSYSRKILPRKTYSSVHLKNFILKNSQKIKLVKNGEQYDIIIEAFTEEEVPNSLVGFFCLKDKKGDYYLFNSVNSRPTPSKVPFIFKDQIIDQSIAGLEEFDNKSTYYLNPNYKENVIDHIKEQIESVSRNKIGYKKEINLVGKVRETDRASMS